MKNKIFLFLFFYQFLFSQQQYTVRYAVVPTKGSLENIDEYSDKTQDLKDFFLVLSKDADKTLNVLEYHLIVNNDKSVFKLVAESPTDFKLNKWAIGLATKDIFYSNKYVSLKETTFNKEKFIITSPLVNNWTLIKESKIIDGYKCFKATCEKPWRSSPELNENKLNYTISAWYCPKIASIFQPKGLGGLPGLILELQDNKITFLMKSINYNSVEPIDFSEIDKIKHLTEQEFHQKVEDLKQMMFGKK